MKKKILFSILGVGLFAVAIMFNVQNLNNARAEAKMENEGLCCNNNPGTCTWMVNGEEDFSCKGSFVN